MVQPEDVDQEAAASGVGSYFTWKNPSKKARHNTIITAPTTSRRWRCGSGVHLSFTGSIGERRVVGSGTDDAVITPLNEQQRPKLLIVDDEWTTRWIDPCLSPRRK
jgi:hypothetical protein